MAGNNTLADDKALYDWFNDWSTKIQEKNPNFKGYDLSGGDLLSSVSVDIGKKPDVSAVSATDMLKLVRLSMPTLMRSGMSGQDVLIKRVIDNPNIELTEEGLRNAGFSDGDIDLFMKDDRFLEAVKAREDKKYKEEWSKKYEDKSLFKEFPMETAKDSIFYIKPCFNKSSKGGK